MKVPRTSGSPVHKIFFILLLLVGFGYAQSSHRDLARELVRDMQNAIADSISASPDSMTLHFEEVSNEARYLNRCLPILETENEGSLKSATIQVQSLKMSIYQNKTESERNSSYLRQLELSVIFTHAGQGYRWKGSISDNLSKAHLKQLLGEDFPTVVQGDFTRNEPPLILITLTTLGVFSLGAALFFIRT